MKKADEQNHSFSNRELLQALRRFLSPYKGRLIIASLARLVGDLVWLYPAYALASIVNFFADYNSATSLFPVWWILIGVFTATTVRAVGHYIMSTLGYNASEQAVLDAEVAGMEQLFSLDLAWHEKENSGNKLKRIERGAQAIDDMVRIWFRNLIEITVNIIGMIIILSTVDHLVAFIVVAFAISFSLISTPLLRLASAAAKEVNGKEENLHGILFESINNIRTAKVLNLPQAMLVLVRATTNEVYQKIKIRIFRFQSRSTILRLWSGLFYVGGFVVIILGIRDGRWEIGFLILFQGYFMRVYEAVQELSDVAQDLTIHKYSISRMMDILNIPIYKEGKDATKTFPKNWKTISLKNVNFAYGSDEVLKHVSFDIHRGEKIGIVGLSGAGKSTLFKLLLKENENYSGEILIDNIPLRIIKKSSFYDRATVVLQETEVFNFSLAENITIANPSKAKDKKALQRALDIAHVTSFLPRLPDGVKTLIGEKGIKLSGGEKQRVGIARAIFKEPDLLFLDEATSHLDLESEEKIRDSLHIFFQNVTAVVIAHRLTTIKEMDRIFVLEAGELIEQGSFQELRAKHGRFYDLWEKQKLSV